MYPPPNNADSNEVHQRGGAGTPAELDEARDYPMYDGDDSANSVYPMSSESAPTRLRGGAGGSRTKDDAANRTVYGPSRQYSVVSYAGGAEEFLAQALAMLNLRPTQDTYQFHIDIYNNREKNQAQKPYQRRLDIDNTNFHEMYTQSIERPLDNFEHDWLLAVAPPRGKIAKAPYTFSPATSSVHVPPKPPPKASQKKSRILKSPQKTFGIGRGLHAEHRRKSPRGTLKIHEVYGYPGVLTCQDKGYDLLDAAIRVAEIDLTSRKPWTMHVYLPRFQGAAAQPPGHHADSFSSTQNRMAWEECGTSSSHRSSLAATLRVRFLLGVRIKIRQSDGPMTCFNRRSLIPVSFAWRHQMVIPLIGNSRKTYPLNMVSTRSSQVSMEP